MGKKYNRISIGDKYLLKTPLQRYGRTPMPRGLLLNLVVIVAKDRAGKNSLNRPLIVTDFSASGTVFLSYYKLRMYYNKI
jgi:Mg-chelatase subunit ChlD